MNLKKFYRQIMKGIHCIFIILQYHQVIIFFAANKTKEKFFFPVCDSLHVISDHFMHLFSEIMMKSS